MSGKLRGAWNDNTSWEFVYGSEMPDSSLCTAVYCVALLPEQHKVVLTRNHRGWEMLGGHIEPSETPEEAMVRECLEEGGYIPEQYQLFGYLKLTSKRLVPHVSGHGHYPFPTGFVPHFIATSTLPLQAPTGEETAACRAFVFDEMAALSTNHLPFIRAGLACFDDAKRVRAERSDN